MFALCGVSVSLCCGQIFGVLALNGSGKSSLIELLSTVLFPDPGMIHIFGRVKQYPKRTRRLKRSEREGLEGKRV